MKKINIGSILGDCIVDIRLKNDSQIYTGYLIKSKHKKGYDILPLQMWVGILSISKSDIVWIRYKINNFKIYYKDIDWNN